MSGTTLKAIRIITATQLTEKDFYTHTRLGASLLNISFDKEIYCNAVFGNSGEAARGLSEIFNLFIDAQYAHEILLFVHDDVSIDDYFIRQRLNDALQHYDVVGVAGNIDADDNDVSWYFKPAADDQSLEKIETEKLSGAVAHAQAERKAVNYYGPSPASCQRLDGCFIAINTEKILRARLRFDERFRFHFYDLDFSRSCHEAGLKVGTWPIAITHASGGSFGTTVWLESCRDYVIKWHSADSPVLK